MSIPLDILARDNDLVYALSDLLGMHSAIAIHYAELRKISVPHLGDNHFALRRQLNAAVNHVYTVRTDAVRASLSPAVRILLIAMTLFYFSRSLGASLL
jgi:hypothetical protein